jgi:predicted GNAT family acetyltransferase
VTIEVKRFATAADLRHAVEPFLMRNEAHHNLLLGLIDRLEGNPEFYGPLPYLAAVFQEGETVAVAVMTPPLPLVLSLCEADEAFAPLAADLRDFRPDVAGVNSPNARPFAEAWQALTGEPYEVRLAQRCYRLERLKEPQGVAGAARRAGEGDIELLTTWELEFEREAVPWEEAPLEVTQDRLRRLLWREPETGGFYFWEVEGRPVSLAGYGNPTPNSMRVGPVYTPPAERGHGYASACTAAACRFILDSGKSFVTLFADLANPTSNRIYMALGFEPVYDAEMLRFAGR